MAQYFLHMGAFCMHIERSSNSILRLILSLMSVNTKTNRNAYVEVLISVSFKELILCRANKLAKHEGCQNTMAILVMCNQPALFCSMEQ